MMDYALDHVGQIIRAGSISFLSDHTDYIFKTYRSVKWMCYTTHKYATNSVDLPGLQVQLMAK